MNLSGRLFDQVGEYLQEYLFGFDREQLSCSVLSGNVVLEKVNLRPDKLSEVMAAVGLPFMLKAGMISRFELKLNYFKMMGGMNLFGSADDG